MQLRRDHWPHVEPSQDRTANVGVALVTGLPPSRRLLSRQHLSARSSCRVPFDKSSTRRTRQPLRHPHGPWPDLLLEYGEWERSKCGRGSPTMERCHDKGGGLSG